MAERSDRELIEAARQGDARAMDELLGRHEKRVYRFGLRICGSEEDAREVLQETLVAAFRGLTGFRGEAEISTWLYQLARNSCLRHRRKRVGEPESFESMEGAAAVPGGGEPESHAHAKQLAEVLQAAILALPETAREAVVLKDVEGLSAEEAAKVVGIEVAAFKSRLHRARLELRQHLSTLLGEESTGQGACPELSSELAAYAGEELDRPTCERIEAHLERCPKCADACESLKRSVSLCRRIPGDEVPAPVRAAVRRALAGAAGTNA